LFAVYVVAVATPLELVFPVVVFVVLRNVPLAPVAGAVNVTGVPAVSTVLPNESSTVAIRTVVKADPIVLL
jgi:hypothetical protein